MAPLNSAENSENDCGACVYTVQGCEYECHSVVQDFSANFMQNGIFMVNSVPPLLLNTKEIRRLHQKYKIPAGVRQIPLGFILKDSQLSSECVRP